MKTKTLLFLILLAFHAASAQDLMSHRGNRNQTYPKVEAVNPEFMNMANQVSIESIEANIRWMQEIGIRAAETPVALETQIRLVEQFESFGLDVYTHHFPYWGDTLDAGNVVAIQKGTVYPDEYIVISSHYDHQDGPGADDNASGTAGVLEIAKILSQHSFKRSIIYAPFNCEEYGLVGSDYFAQKCADEDMNILGCFNMDMIAYYPEDRETLEFYYGASYISYRLADFYTNTARIYFPNLYLAQCSRGDSNGSDHVSFNMREYPAIYFNDMEYMNPHYHTPADSLGVGANNLELTQGFIKTILVAAAELVDGFLPPQNLGARPSEAKIIVQWDATPETNKYKVFKNNLFLIETEAASFSDTDVVLGEEYIYHVTGIHRQTGKESAISNQDTVLMSLPLTLPYHNDFENGTGLWRATPGWHCSKANSYSGDYSLSNSSKISVSYNYLSIAEFPWFSIPDTTTNLILSFYLRGVISNEISRNPPAYFEITTDRKTWKKAAQVSGQYNHWTGFQISLNDYIGEDFVQIRLRLQSAGGVSSSIYCQIFVDNLQIAYEGLSLQLIPDNVRVTDYDAPGNAAEIKWDGMAPSYNVYRDGVKINNDPVKMMQYVDTEAISADMCYQVTGIVGDGEESELSEKACIKDYLSVENLSFTQIIIAPNPSSGVVEIATGLKNLYVVAIYDMQGRRVLLKERFSDGKIDLSHLSKGAYILKIANGQHAVSKKIILQ